MAKFFRLPLNCNIKVELFRVPSTEPELVISAVILTVSLASTLVLSAFIFEYTKICITCAIAERIYRCS